jgi:hypothetical protein
MKGRASAAAAIFRKVVSFCGWEHSPVDVLAGSVTPPETIGQIGRMPPTWTDPSDP